jgi:serine protease Do
VGFFFPLFFSPLGAISCQPMNRTLAPRFLLLGLLLAPAAALPAREPAAPAAAPAPTAPADPSADAIDDDALYQGLVDRTEQLVNTRKTVALAKLIKQLAATRCKLPLAPLPAGEKLTAGQIYQRHRDSVVVIGGLHKSADDKTKWESSVATGFALGDGSAIATCYHVVNNTEDVTLVVMTRDGKIFPVSAVLAASVADDLAILRVDGLKLPPLALSTDAPVGSDVTVISHPDTRFYSLSRGMVTRYSIVNGDHGKTTILETSADFAGGSSGGPVFNDRGAVVGVVTSTQTAYSDDDSEPAAVPPADKPPKKGDKPGAAATAAPTPKAPATQDPQMIFKECVPTAKLLLLIEKN